MTRWTIDPTHSEIRFKVKHLVVSTVTGQFDRFTAVIEGDAQDFSDAKITFSADADSINTKNEQRDAHLKSADFFDAGNHPVLSFVSTAVKKTSDFELEVTGDLSIRGVTRPVTLAVTYNGTVSGFGGATVAAFEIAGTINRFDYGLKWNALTEAGGVAVGNEVKLQVLAEFVRAQDVSKAA